MISSVFDEMARQLSAAGVAYAAGPTSVVPSTAALPEGLRSTLQGPKGRQLDVSAWEVAGKLVVVWCILDTRTRQTAYVRDLMKASGQAFSYDDFRFDVTRGTPRPQDVARQMVSVVLANETVFEVLRGNEWLDVPFDWAGMR